jgi:hypothetical protein
MSDVTHDANGTRLPFRWDGLDTLPDGRRLVRLDAYTDSPDFDPEDLLPTLILKPIQQRLCANTDGWEFTLRHHEWVDEEFGDDEWAEAERAAYRVVAICHSGDRWRCLEYADVPARLVAYSAGGAPWQYAVDGAWVTEWQLKMLMAGLPLLDKRPPHRPAREYYLTDPEEVRTKYWGYVAKNRKRPSQCVVAKLVNVGESCLKRSLSRWKLSWPPPPVGTPWTPSR